MCRAAGSPQARTVRFVLSRARVSALVLMALAGLELESPAPDVPRVAVYAYPVPMAVMPLMGKVSNFWLADFPVGASIRINPTTAVDVEAQWIGMGFGSGDMQGWGISAAVGPSLRLWRGFYVDAHARFTVFKPAPQTFFNPGCIGCCTVCGPPTSPGSNGPADLGPGWTRAFTAEVDVGYAWTFGHFYLSPQLGLGGGYAFDYNDPTHAGMLVPFADRTTPNARTNSFVWTLNVNLLRVGVAL
jgi:hypothetical protein